MQSGQEAPDREGRPGVPERQVATAPRAGDPESSGWERRFEADATRVAEHAGLYSSLGYEVMTVGLNPEAFDPECASCALTACKRYVTLYTRRLSRAGGVGGVADMARAGEDTAEGAR